MGQSFAPDILREIHTDINDFEFDLDLIIAGYDKNGAHLHMISDPGMSRNLGDIGYVAIGSGETHAEATFMEAQYVAFWPYEHALYMVYRAKKIAERAPGVGSATDIIVLGSDGCEELPAETIDELNEMYKIELKERLDYDSLKRKYKQKK
jgi:20S proteasome alpha/beta subunit